MMNPQPSKLGSASPVTSAGTEWTIHPIGIARRGFGLFVLFTIGLFPFLPAPLRAQETLTLREAVRIALERSPTLKQAEASELQSSAGGWDAWNGLIPSVRLASSLNGSEVLQRTASDPITGGIVQLPDSLIQLRETFGSSSNLMVDWTLFDGGQTLQGMRRARAEARAGEFSLQAARSRVVATVTLAYLDAVEAMAMEEALRAEVVRTAEMERTAVGRFEVGEVPELDALQARLTASEAEMNLMDAETAAFTARLGLFEHLQLPADSDLRLTDSIPAVDLPADGLETLRERALAGSPELSAARERLEGARRGHEAARLWFLPSVSIGATISRSEFGQTREAFTFSPRNEQTYYRMNLSWNPLGSLGGTIANGRRAHAAVRTAEAEVQLRRSTLVTQVASALDRIERARILQERSRVNLELAERQLDQAEERYRLGLAPFSERLTAQALAAEAQRQAIVARFATLRGVAELELASGVAFLPWGPAAR